MKHAKKWKAVLAVIALGTSRVPVNAEFYHWMQKALEEYDATR